MTTINYIDNEDFLRYLIGLMPIDEGDIQNYQHTHNRVRYDPDSTTLSYEEVCINEYGSCYGIGRGGCACFADENSNT